MKPLHARRVAVAIPFCILIPALNAFAQTTTLAAADDRLTKLEGAVTNAQMAGDNAWMLTCAALVLMMTGPGLALFYGGLVRKKNVLSTMMQSFILMAVITVLWAIYGYSLAFRKVITFWQSQLLVSAWCRRGSNATMLRPFSLQTFIVYQLMFAIITPALITGAFAERIKFSAMLLFTVLWATIVYFLSPTWCGARRFL